MNEPDLLLIDVNGLGYAAMYQPNLAKLEHQGFSTAALHGALMSVFMRMGELPKATPLVIWDGRAQWRHDMYPGYKANRKDDESKKAIRDAYALQVPWIQLILNRLGIPQVRCASAEADDIAGVLSRTGFVMVDRVEQQRHRLVPGLGRKRHLVFAHVKKARDASIPGRPEQRAGRWPFCGHLGIPSSQGARGRHLGRHRWGSRRWTENGGKNHARQRRKPGVFLGVGRWWEAAFGRGGFARGRTRVACDF